MAPLEKANCRLAKELKVKSALRECLAKSETWKALLTPKDLQFCLCGLRKETCNVIRVLRESETPSRKISA